jgi:hypothetical protein
MEFGNASDSTKRADGRPGDHLFRAHRDDWMPLWAVERRSPVSQDRRGHHRQGGQANRPHLNISAPTGESRA